MHGKYSWTKPISLEPVLQKYPWGMEGDSWVRRLWKGGGFDGPGAELWYGAHPSAPASAELADGVFRLDELVKHNRVALLGPAEKSYAGAFPFLAKVLSVGRPLSVQLHPPEELARTLHQDQPRFFPDPYAKDEGSIALTTVELLLGHRRLEEILALLKEYPETHPVLRPEELPPEDEAGRLKALTRQIFSAEKSVLEESCRALYERAVKVPPSAQVPIEKWIIRTRELYPHGDEGVFFLFLLNYVQMNPGQAVAIPAGRIHEYLSGELLEGMRPSDNVIRCAFTTKHKDVELMFKSADFTPHSPEELLFSPVAIEPGQELYRFGFDAFEVNLLRGATTARLQRRVPSILLSLDAEGELETADANRLAFSPADAFMLAPADSVLTVKVESGRLVQFSGPAWDSRE